MRQLRFTREEIVWQEVPGEVSLAFLIAGCPLRCKGCHSADSWKADAGVELTEAYLKSRLQRYAGLIGCVLFLGGEWEPERLLLLLKTVGDAGLKACLYTGLEREELPQELLPYLTFLKTGRWMEQLGGLNRPGTNQRFVDLRTGRILNYLFIKGE